MQKFTKLRSGAWRILLVAALSLPHVSSAKQQLQQAPNFTLPSISGANLRLSEYRGEVVLVNFWASWCGPCRQEMPLLNKMYQRYKKAGFTLLGVNVDLEKDRAKAQNIAEQLKLSFPVLFDSKQQIVDTYKVASMPSSVLVDRDGNIRYVHLGYKPGDEKLYSKKVKELLIE
ncbi:MAG: TlpA disulfide reductase family protein [Pseudomonadales bacterium]